MGEMDDLAAFDWQFYPGGAAAGLQQGAVVQAYQPVGDDYQTRSMPMYLVHPYQGGQPKRTQVLVDYLIVWFKRSGEALDRL